MTSVTELHFEKLPKTIELFNAGDAGVASSTNCTSESVDTNEVANANAATKIKELVPCVRFVDQQLLPQELKMVTTQDYQCICDAIARLGVRGAPAIGVAGAAAVVLWMAQNREQICKLDQLREACVYIAQIRPTAVNLSWAVSQMQSLAENCILAGESPSTILEKAFAFACELQTNDIAINKQLAEYGAGLFEPNTRVLTHCNAGSLATVFYGTALGVIYTAAKQGKIAHVYSDETRPLGQGARLTVWELAQVGIPVTLQCDNMAARLMQQKQIDCVIVGADRITAQGDVANKIGTYSLAVLAHYHKIPFYVAAPSSSFDFTLQNGEDIPIENRAASEVSSCIPDNVSVYNPAFDVTPASLVSAIITEYGVFKPQDLDTLKKRMQQ